MTEAERKRFHELRQRELSGGTLTTEDARELAELIADIDAEESHLLQRAAKEREAQVGELDEQVARMRSLVARQEALVNYLRRIGQEVDAERDAIDVAFRQLMSSSSHVVSSR